MCGIVGIVGTGPWRDQIVEALKRLEYRGYDSAGVATLEDGRLDRRRAEGKLRNLEAKLENAPLPGLIGIGHTRWATHGKPNETNAHPHATDKLAVVHNGIIENFRELKTEPRGRRACASRPRPTPRWWRNSSPARCVGTAARSRRSRRDACRVCAAPSRSAFLFAGEDDLMIGARHGAPLAIGYGDGEMYLGSDALALAPFTDEVAYLEDGDWAIAHAQAASTSATRPAQSVAAARAQDRHRLLPRRQGQSPPLHGEGDPRAAGGRRADPRQLCRTSPPDALKFLSNCRSTSRT